MTLAHRVISIMCAASAITLSAGCQTAPLTQTQMDALQVRQVEAPPERAFAAASSALIDAGYLVRVSDGDAGVLTGEKREDPAVAGNVAVVMLTALLTHCPTDIPPTYHAVSVQVLPLGAAQSSVRIRPFLNGAACACNDADPGGHDTVTQIWELMQRQVLMKELPVAPPTSKPQGR